MVVQRVVKASVEIDGHLYSSIGPGALIFIGIHADDTPAIASKFADKLAFLRIFGDLQGKMNLSLKDIQGEALVVSQFTLYGNCSKGRRPDFLQAAPPPIAIPLYERFIDELKKEIPFVKTGQFGAAMQISLINDGPVTLLFDSAGL
ncbi:MAG: D-aminoacyl-tRNA deacylase [Parachlamydia sp.]|nr:D-aminoacyl-tRNA deacylase [Parachlamydia sp.]